MIIHDQTNNVARFLTSQETIELARIQKDNSVIAYALFSLSGEEIESSGAWRSMLGPVFANIFDMVDRFGEEFGERENCPMLVMESPDFEIAGVLLSSARAVFVKRKQKQVHDVLRSVG